jgi:hypothetical protein
MEERKDVRWLLMDMAYAFAMCGASAQSVEYNLMLVSMYYGLKGYYSVSQTTNSNSLLGNSSRYLAEFRSSK